KVSDESCPPLTSLAPGDAITCTASYTITQDDLDDGTVTNIATGQASFAGNAVTANQASETVAALQNPELSLEKVANPLIYDKVGDIISYEYELTNSGNVTLAGPVTVTDDQPTVICPSLATTGNL